MNKGMHIHKYAKNFNSTKFIRSVNSETLKTYADACVEGAEKEMKRRNKNRKVA